MGAEWWYHSQYELLAAASIPACHQISPEMRLLVSGGHCKSSRLSGTISDISDIYSLHNPTIISLVKFFKNSYSTGIEIKSICIFCDQLQLLFTWRLKPPHIDKVKPRQTYLISNNITANLAWLTGWVLLSFLIFLSIFALSLVCRFPSMDTKYLNPFMESFL